MNIACAALTYLQLSMHAVDLPPETLPLLAAALDD